MVGDPSRTTRQTSGFSILELICVLVLLGFLGLLSSQMVSNAVRGYRLARNSDAAVQKAQNAMQRLTVDLTYVLSSSASSGNINIFTYNTTLNPTVTVSVFQTDNQIIYRYDGTNYVLTDGVKASSLAFTYYTRYDSSTANFTSGSTNLIGFSYTMAGSDPSLSLSQTYSTRVKIGKVSN